MSRQGEVQHFQAGDVIQGRIPVSISRGGFGLARAPTSTIAPEQHIVFTHRSSSSPLDLSWQNASFQAAHSRLDCLAEPHAPNQPLHGTARRTPFKPLILPTMASRTDPDVGCVIPEAGQWPVDPQEDVPIREDRLWIDGCFDFFHHGTAQAPSSCRGSNG